MRKCVLGFVLLSGCTNFFGLKQNPYSGSVTIRFSQHSAASGSDNSTRQETAFLEVSRLGDAVHSTGSYTLDAHNDCVGMCSGNIPVKRGKTYVRSQGTVAQDGDIESQIGPDGTYILSFTPPHFDVTSEAAGCCDDAPTQGSGSWKNWSTMELESGNPAPRALNGNKVLDDSPGFASSVEWHLSRDEDDKVIVDEPTGYADWLPAVGPNESTPGGPGLTVTAHLVSQNGSAPSEAATSFRFELVDFSSEPGIALNKPKHADAKETPDLQFDVGLVNDGLTITEAGVVAETSGGGRTDATAHIASYDLGGWASLRVVAVMADGRELVGRFNDDGARTELLLPKRTRPSHIADSWLAAHAPGQKDDDDLDDAPVGNRVKGDGLSVYEEYRGVSENGTVVRLEPRQKDLFLRVDAAFTDDPKVGIDNFEAATQLTVHRKLLEDEIAPDHGVNFNCQNAHVTNQHGLLLVPSANADGEATPGPGTPGMITLSQIPTMAAVASGNPDPVRKVAEFNAFIAHELGHSVAIKHHADSPNEGFRDWEQVALGGGLVRYDEKGGPSVFTINPVYDNGAPFPGTLGFPVHLWIAAYNGEHSGWDGCVMRYDNANAFQPAAGSSERRFLETAEWEFPGTSLCDASNGGVVHPRHGKATRGNCQGQIQVNDEIRPPP